MIEKQNALYVRASQEDLEKGVDEQSATIENQIDFIEHYAKENNIVIHQYYIDDGYTGINFDRPGFEKLKQDIEAEKIGMIITKDFSRLGRQFLDTCFYVSEYFPEKNVRYVAINESYDSSSNNNNNSNSYSKIMVAIKSIVNDKYVKDVSVRIKETKRMKTEKGFYMGFIAPYGYKKVRVNEKITLEVDEEAAYIVKRIFEDIAKRKIKKRSNDCFKFRRHTMPHVIS